MASTITASSAWWRDQLVALIGEGGAGVLEVAGHLLAAVVDVPRADQLVARVVEGLDRRLELVPVLGLHVLDHELLALATKLLADGHGPTLSRCGHLQEGGRRASLADDAMEVEVVMVRRSTRLGG